MRFSPSFPKARRCVASLLCLILCTVLLAACGDEKPAGHKLMLWKATLPQGNGTAYLLGTIHEAPPDLYPLDRGYTQAFDAADRLVVEINLAALKPAKVARQAKALSTLPQGLTLHEVIGSELWQSLLENLDSFGLGDMNRDRLNKLQPLPVAFMLLTQSLSTVQVERGLGIESYFMKRAQERNLPIDELEGLLFQLQLFASIPLEQQTRYLAMILNQGSSALSENYLSLADAWKQGDLDAVANIVRTERESDPALEPFYAAILEGRNPSMANAVAEYVHQGGVSLVLVGAAHLHGKLGILELLKKRGFQIERMTALGRPDSTS